MKKIASINLTAIMASIMNQQFVDSLYDYMFQYINRDVMESIFHEEINQFGIRFTVKKNVNDERFGKSHYNTICFKGDRETGGHWVYVDGDLKPHSTYECRLLYDDDDGLCHGATMIYAFRLQDKYPLSNGPCRSNYESLMNFYLWLLTSGKWKKALVDCWGAELTPQVMGAKIARSQTLIEKFINELP